MWLTQVERNEHGGEGSTTFTISEIPITKVITSCADQNMTR